VTFFSDLIDDLNTDVIANYLVAIPGVEALARRILPEKLGFSLTFLHVELRNMQSSQNFDDLFFAHLKGEFNRHFRMFFGTNWDKSARDYRPVHFER